MIEAILVVAGVFAIARFVSTKNGRNLDCERDMAESLNQDLVSVHSHY